MGWPGRSLALAVDLPAGDAEASFGRQDSCRLAPTEVVCHLPQLLTAGFESGHEGLGIVEVVEGMDVGHELGQVGVRPRDEVHGGVVVGVLVHGHDVLQVPLGRRQRHALIGRQGRRVQHGQSVEPVLRQSGCFGSVSVREVVQRAVVETQFPAQPQVGRVLRVAREHRPPDLVDELGEGRFSLSDHGGGQRHEQSEDGSSQASSHR